MPHLIQRGKRKTWHLYRRVPKRFSHLETSPHFMRSLHTESLSEAEDKASKVWDVQTAIWEAKLAGADTQAAELHRHLVEIADKRGFTYKPAPMLAHDDLSDIVRRISEAADQEAPIADALLGAVDHPPIMVSELFETYKELKSVEIRNKSEGQLTKWTNDRKRATSEFIRLVGDRDAMELSRDDATLLRSKLADRIHRGKIVEYSANRLMITLNAMINDVSTAMRSTENKPFANLLFKDPKKKRRHKDMITFRSEWIADNILAPDALKAVNTEAADILALIALIGIRPSEACNLKPDAIKLVADTPHLSIRPDGRELKSAAAERDLPLIGRALEIMQRNPEGFPRYADKAAVWSATANKFMKTHLPLPSDRHTAYALRHAFRDRLRNAGCPDTIADQLFGHEEEGTVYGEGVWLSVAAEWLEKIEIPAGT